jgi:hypothetical protein
MFKWPHERGDGLENMAVCRIVGGGGYEEDSNESY